MIKTVLGSLMAKQRLHWEGRKIMLSSPKQAAVAQLSCTSRAVQRHQ